MTVGNNVYYVGDILLQKQNNYKALIDNDKDDSTFEEFDDEEVMFIANGECSVISDINTKNEYIIHQCNNQQIRYYKSDMVNVGLGYSYTIHKSQGSTIKVVLLVTPRSHAYMLTSNLLYVGITRTSEYCFHFGNPAMIDKAIYKKDNFKRNTYMQELLTA